ncbi:hypothetical protein FACS1894187_06260 [Synergistales bacterium]|nr:hypothetical protein FACS1894187_06260 [Synergistales bacterium]
MCKNMECKSCTNERIKNNVDDMFQRFAKTPHFEMIALLVRGECERMNDAIHEKRRELGFYRNRDVSSWPTFTDLSSYEKIMAAQEEKVVPEPKALRVFSFEGKETRVVDVNGEPWWVASEVCDVLGLNDVSKATKRLDVDEKLIRKIFVSGQNRDVITVSESGVYALIMRSNKPEAKRFRKWVTSEVLPAIRKTGGYSAPALAVSPHQELRDLIEQNRGVIGKVALGKLVLMLAASIQADATKA